MRDILKSILLRLHPSKGSLTARTMDAAGWNLVRTGAEFVFRLGSNLIMTRLLFPEAFGLLAFAMTFATAVALLTDIGIHQSIVREKGMTSPRFLRVAWTVKILRSGAICLGVLIIAGVFGLIGPTIGSPESVVAQPEMPLLIAMTGFAPVAEGLVSTNWDVAIRKMQYKRIVLLEVSSLVIRIVCQVSFALISPTVWALLAGTFAGGFGKALLSHILLEGPKMRLAWDKAMSLKMWDYGKWIMGSSALTFLVNNTDKLIFGAMVSSISMGLYVIAFIWVGVGQRVQDIFSRLLGFPLVAEIMRERPDEARRLMRKYQTFVDLICLFGFLLLAQLGPLLVQVLYTPAYAGAGPIIQLLSPLVLATRFNQLTNVLLASGDSRTQFRMTAIVAVATVTFVLGGLQLGGFEGAITGMVVARFTSVPYLLSRTVVFFGARHTLFDALFGVGAVIAALLLYALV